jgi:hypothetical protein
MGESNVDISGPNAQTKLKEPGWMPKIAGPWVAEHRCALDFIRL